jgi:hypothetical protein
MTRHAYWGLLLLPVSNTAAVAAEPPAPLELARGAIEYRVKSCSRGRVKLRVVGEVGPQPSETKYDIQYDSKRIKVVRTARLLGSESWGAPVTQVVGADSIIDDSSPGTAVQVMPLDRYKDPKEGMGLIDPVPLGMVSGGALFLHRARVDSLLMNAMVAPDVKVAPEGAAGERLWRVTRPGASDKAEITVSYAPSEGFGVRRIELRATQGTQTVHDLTETTLKQYPANGTWYPAVVRHTITVDGAVTERHVTHVDAATFGEQAGDAAYTLAGLSLAPGRSISDSTDGRPRGQVWDGSKAVPAAEVEAQVPGPSSSRRPLLIYLAVGLFVLGVFLTLLVARKKLRPGATAGSGNPPAGDRSD